MTIAQPRPGPTADRRPLTQSPISRSISRRSLMARAAVVTGGLAASGTVLAACGGSSGVSESTRIAAQLAPLALDASADSAAARALIARTPDRAAALTVIANERQTHATTLNDEIARLAPDLARPSTATGVAAADPTPTSGSPATTSPSAPATPVATTVDQLRRRLAAATTTTGELAVTMSGYRAGMLGSIAAALGAEVKVQLA